MTVVGPWSGAAFRRKGSGRPQSIVASAVLLLLAWASPSVPAEDSANPVAIVGSTVVIGDGRTLKDATVVIRDGEIEHVGRGLELPKDVERVDGKGLFVYPGLIDAFREVPSGPAASDDDPALYAYSRVESGQRDDTTDAAWRAGGVLAANLAPDKGIFRGQSSVILLGGARESGELRTSVAMNVSLLGLGYHNRRPGMREPGGPYPNRLIGVFGFVRQKVLDARHLQLLRHDGRDVPAELGDAGVLRSLDALGPVTEGRMPVILPAEADRELRRALRLAEELSIRPILAGAHDAARFAATLGAKRVPVFFSLHFVDQDADVHPEFNVPLRVMRDRQRASSGAGLLARAGVPLAFYSDGLEDGAAFLAGLRRVVRAGLDEDTALHAATLGAAELLGVEDRLGSVEAGKSANLIVADGNLLEEGTGLRMVFVAGRVYAPEAPQVAWESAPSREPYPVAVPDPFEGLMPDLGSVVLIRNANIMTVTHGTLQGSSLLIKNGRIAAVGDDLVAPQGAQVIDATGKWITPGFIDCHSHIATDSHNDSGTNMDSLASTGDVINPLDMPVYRTLSAGVTSANVLHGSVDPIGGQTVVIKNRWGTTAEEMIFEGAKPGLKFAIKEFASREGAVPPSTLMGIEAFYRESLTRAQHYAAEWDRYEKQRADGVEGLVPPRRNLRLEPIVEMMRGDRYLHVHLYKPEEISLMIRVAEEFGFKVRVFQHVTWGYENASAIARHGGGASIFSDHGPANPYNAAILSHHGIVTSINSDNETWARHFNHEVARLRKYGDLGEDDALALITLNPARQLGIEDRVGSVDVGKDADLVLFDRYPLSVYAVPELVFIDGRVYFSRNAERERQRRIADMEQSLAAARKGSTNVR